MSKFFKIYCYTKNDPEALAECSEVSIQASPEVLRELSSFLRNAADKLERSSGNIDHIHLQDETKSRSDEFPDVIAVLPTSH